jgi:hypothetical protein
MRNLALVAAVLVALAVLVAGCGEDDGSTDPDREAPAAAPERPDRPDVPEGPLDGDVEEELDAVLSELTFLSQGDIGALGESGDVRVAWVLVDLLRFHQIPEHKPLETAPATLTGVELTEGVAWVAYSDLLLAWDIPAPPGYFERKRAIYLVTEPSWEPFFDPDGDLDWREVSWGGVSRDGIDALVDPVAIPAEDADWLPDDDIVFGAVIDGEARAYPRRILEVHEMANDTLGGRRVALSYCTLCGSPILHAVDDVEGVDEPLELRTSGLLQRANKLMYDVQTESLFDQFRGRALTGPLGQADVVLTPLPLAVATWREWRDEHPGTKVIDIPETRGRERGFAIYTGDLFERRDADGPIFLVGERDDRLPEQTRVFGVETPRGVAVAFPVAEARDALRSGEPVEAAGVVVRLEEAGLVARPAEGGPALVAHEAFWFAWSQFRPDTHLWEP